MRLWETVKHADDIAKLEYGETLQRLFLNSSTDEGPLLSAYAVEPFDHRLENQGRLDLLEK